MVGALPTCFDKLINLFSMHGSSFNLSAFVNINAE